MVSMSQDVHGYLVLSFSLRIVVVPTCLEFGNEAHATQKEWKVRLSEAKLAA